MTLFTLYVAAVRKNSVLKLGTLLSIGIPWIMFLCEVSWFVNKTPKAFGILVELQPISADLPQT